MNKIFIFMLEGNNVPIPPHLFKYNISHKSVKMISLNHHIKIFSPHMPIKKFKELCNVISIASKRGPSVREFSLQVAYMHSITSVESSYTSSLPHLLIHINRNSFKPLRSP